MSGVNLNIFKGFLNEEDLVSYFLTQAYTNNETVIASFVFTNVNKNSTSLPNILRYTIHQNASFTQTTKRKVRDRYWFHHPDRTIISITSSGLPGCKI
jgi:hypothetical protein